jgi:hypothetical protein
LANKPKVPEPPAIIRFIAACHRPNFDSDLKPIIMKTTVKATALIISAIVIIKATMACRQAYSGLRQRYVSEAKGKAQAFINSWMY